MKVFDWIHEKSAPDKPTVEDMRYGIGCMNDLLMTISVQIAELLEKTGELHEYDPHDLINNVNRSTLGRQFNILKEHYTGQLIEFQKMKHLVKERNYFIHDYQIKNPCKSDSQRMFNLIQLLNKASNQLKNATLKTSKEAKKQHNLKNDELRKCLIKSVKACKQYDGHVLLSDIGNEMSRNGYKCTGGLQMTMEKFGWKVYEDKGNHLIKYVRAQEIR